MNTVTRKVQLIFDSTDKEKIKLFYTDLRRWKNICRKAANIISSTHYIMENVKDLFFLDDGTKAKLADIKKDENGILTCSKLNTTYQLLSKTFKGEIPMIILSSLNTQIVASFNEEKKEVFLGSRSIRNYKNDIPIPLPVQMMRGLSIDEKSTVTFNMAGYNMKVVYGKDLSNNKLFFERALSGKYKLCDSSIQIEDGGKIFLLAVFQFESDNIDLNSDRIAEVSLDVESPMILKIGEKKPIKIGNKEEYLHRRLAIQGALRRTQVACRFNKGGKGIHKKIKAIERYEEAEANYIKYRIHSYSRMLIDLCVKNQCGKILLVNQKEKEKDAKEDKFILRNWTYYGLKEKIKYKASFYKIEVVDEEEIQESEVKKNKK